MIDLFEAIDVWQRQEHLVVRYRCFKVLSTGKYCVQSRDCYSLPLDVVQLNYLDRQFLELLVEEAPNSRSDTYDSLEEAIRRHDLHFANS
jgi:hypothetical protein